jgi:hypothetical protein
MLKKKEEFLMKRIKGVLTVTAVLLLSMTIVACKEKWVSTGNAAAVQSGPVDPAKLKVAVALGWMANESGWNLKAGHQGGLAAIRVPESNIVYFDASYRERTLTLWKDQM